MKTFSPIRVLRAVVAGFSLMEILVVVAILSLVVLCVVSAQLFGLRIYTTSKAKLETAADARKVIYQVRRQVREAKTVYVGNYKSLVNFTSKFPVVTNGLQQGNALKILPTTNSTPFYIYYADDSMDQLKVYDSSLKSVQVLADNVINSTVFDSEDFQGNVLSGYQDNRIIHMTLEFSQREYFVGQKDYYNSYRISMRATQRTLE